MASKRQQTMAKREREQTVRERRAAKLEKKAARKAAATETGAENGIDRPDEESLPPQE